MKKIILSLFFFIVAILTTDQVRTVYATLIEYNVSADLEDVVNECWRIFSGTMLIDTDFEIIEDQGYEMGRFKGTYELLDDLDSSIIAIGSSNIIVYNFYLQGTPLYNYQLLIDGSLFENGVEQKISVQWNFMNMFDKDHNIFPVVDPGMYSEYLDFIPISDIYFMEDDGEPGYGVGLSRFWDWNAERATPIPEPATMILLCTGLAFLVLRKASKFGGGPNHCL